MPNQWIPISQAPKDGTFVLLYEGEEFIRAGQWIDNAVGDGGYWYAWDEIPNPTHFMFLPDPPNTQG